MKFAKLELARSAGDTLIVRFNEKVGGLISEVIRTAFSKVFGPASRFSDEILAGIASDLQPYLDELATQRRLSVSDSTDTWSITDITMRDIITGEVANAMTGILVAMATTKEPVIEVSLANLVKKNREEAQSICDETSALEKKLKELRERAEQVDNEAVEIFVEAFSTVPAAIQNKIKNRLNKKGLGAN